MLTKRTFVRLLVPVALAATVLVGVGSTPAGAGLPIDCNGNPDATPDGKINANGGPFEGAGSYVDEYLEVSVPGPGQAVFLLKWKNVGDVTHTIRVVDATDFPIEVDTGKQFFVNGVNVSKEMRQKGRLVFFGVQPGKRATVEVVLKNKADGTNFTGARLQGRYGGVPATSCDELIPLIND